MLDYFAQDADGGTNEISLPDSLSMLLWYLVADGMLELVEQGGAAIGGDVLSIYRLTETARIWSAGLGNTNRSDSGCLAPSGERPANARARDLTRTDARMHDPSLKAPYLSYGAGTDSGGQESMPLSPEAITRSHRRRTRIRARSSA